MPSDFLTIAKTLDKCLNLELLLEIEYPDCLCGDYREFSEDQRQLWYSYTFHELIGPVTLTCRMRLGRSLELREVEFIKGRIERFIYSSVIAEYEKM